MVGKREKPEDIVLKLRQVEVLQGQGNSVSEAVRQIGVTVQTYYRWRKKYGCMIRAQLKRLTLDTGRAVAMIPTGRAMLLPMACPAPLGGGIN